MQIHISLHVGACRLQEGRRGDAWIQHGLGHQIAVALPSKGLTLAYPAFPSNTLRTSFSPQAMASWMGVPVTAFAAMFGRM